MKIRLVIPTVNSQPTTRPQCCHDCGHWRLHRHGTLSKPLRDHRQEQVTVERYKCCGCGRTFRHYKGVTVKDQSQRTVVVAALLYGLGLSCHAAAHLLGGLGIELCAMNVWRDAQAAGEALRRTRPAGRVQVLGVDETIYRVKGKETIIGMVTDGQSGLTLDFDDLVFGFGRFRTISGAKTGRIMSQRRSCRCSLPPTIRNADSRSEAMTPANVIDVVGV